MKVIFWNVDTQNDFMNKDGALYVKGAELIKPALKMLTDFAKEKHIRVINTADCHTDKSTELSDKPDFKTTFPPHCMFLGGKGIDFIDETDPKADFKGNYSLVCYTDNHLHHSFNRARNIIIYKDAFDVFAGNPLAEKVVKRLNPKIVVVYGVATNVCVNSAIHGLLDRGYAVWVVQDAIKELPGLPLTGTLDMWRCRGVYFTNTKSIREDLEVT